MVAAWRYSCCVALQEPRQAAACGTASAWHCQCHLQQEQLMGRGADQNQATEKGNCFMKLNLCVKKKKNC